MFDLDASTMQMAAGVVIFLLVLLRPARRSIPLPGPSLMEYLPGGVAHALTSDPHNVSNTFLKLSRRYGSAFQVLIGWRRTVIVSDPDDILHILSLPLDHMTREEGHASAFKQVHKDTLFTIAKDGHSKTRKAVRDNFKATFLPRYHDPIGEATKELTDILGVVATGNGDKSMMLADRTVDIGVVIGIATFRIITNVAFGASMPLQDRQVLSTAINEFVNEMMFEFMGYPYRGWLEIFGTRKNIHRIHSIVSKKCNEIVRARIDLNKMGTDAEKDRVPDVLDGLLGVTADLGHVSGHVFMFTIAGAHAANIALAWAMYETCRDTDLRDRLVAEIDAAVAAAGLSDDDPLTYDDTRHNLKLVEALWNETLRVHPPSGVISRKALKDIELRTTRAIIPAGSPVLLSARNAAVDERYWPNPHTFNPDRWLTGAKKKPGCFLPFGAGKRNCPGEFMANHEGILILAELLRRFDFTLACELDDVKTASEFLELPRCSKKFDGVSDPIGVPLKITPRAATAE